MSAQDGHDERKPPPDHRLIFFVACAGFCAIAALVGLTIAWPEAETVAGNAITAVAAIVAVVVGVRSSR